MFELDGAPYLHLHDMDAIYVSAGADDDAGEDMAEAAAVADFMDGLQRARAPLPAHAPPVLVRTDGLPVAAVAAVRAEDLPATVAAWQGRAVLVDSACRARVTGFALVARVYSEGLAYDETEQRLGPAAVARAIFDDMGHLVLAARLDGCKGSYAQPAEGVIAATPATVLDAHPAVPAAVRALRRSDPGRAAQRMWREHDYPGNWWQDAELTTQVVQHPRTGETFISVHALADVECGGLEINLWGIYRVTDLDYPLALAPLIERKLDNVHALQTFVDIDGDGRFEILASSLWGADTFRLGADGSRQAMLHVPYLDCQC